MLDRFLVRFSTRSVAEQAAIRFSLAGWLGSLFMTPPLVALYVHEGLWGAAASAVLLALAGAMLAIGLRRGVSVQALSTWSAVASKEKGFKARNGVGA